MYYNGEYFYNELYNPNYNKGGQYTVNNNNNAYIEYYYPSYPQNVQYANYHEVNFRNYNTQVPNNKIIVNRKDFIDSHTQFQNKQYPHSQNNQGHPNNIPPKKKDEINNDKFHQDPNIHLNFNYNNTFQNNQLNYNVQPNNQETKDYEYYEKIIKAAHNKNEKTENIGHQSNNKPMTQVFSSNNNGFSLKPEEKAPKNKTEIQQNPNDKTKNTNDNNIISYIQYMNQNYFKSQLPSKYHFPKIGLYNIGSTCYMNAILQCLLHISPLFSFFISIYQEKNNNIFFKKTNESAPTKGEISDAFFEIIKLMFLEEKNKNSNINSMRAKTVINQNYNKISKAVSPEIFQKTVGKYNPQFKNLEANDSKDLILYLLQTMHQELNYWTKNEAFTGYPDQYNRGNSFSDFVKSYDVINFSIISNLFYGTNETITKCLKCNTYIYNFQKFEFLIFGVRFYDKKEFSLYNGFNDYTRIDKLTGDNQYYCNVCKKLCDAEMTTKIILPPKYLLINIDYGKNKKYMPKSINYQNELDITKYMSYNVGKPIKYKLLTICSHMGSSGSFGHYIAYCKQKENGKWYQFNDAFVSECKPEEIINGGDPYLLLYEKID